jgi:hypothetical protein
MTSRSAGVFSQLSTAKKLTRVDGEGLMVDRPMKARSA